MNRTAIIVMLKSPEAGKVKTRLAAAIGDAAALRVYQGLLALTLQNVMATALDVWVALEGHQLPPGWQDIAKNTIPQQGDDLGIRMAHAVRQVMSHGYDSWLIIGGDCPRNTGENMQDAASYLTKTDVVIGATEDGGYYLLGMRGFEPDIFQEIEWSTSKVYEQTVTRIGQKGWHFVNLPVLRDVDTIADLYGNHLGYLLSDT